MKKSMVRVLAAMVLVSAFGAGVAVGCGDDEPAAVGQCNTLIDRICARMVTCGTYTSAATCRSDMQGVLNCSSAVAVGPTYSTCLGEVPAIDCAAFSGSDWLPASCHGVILM